MSYFDKKIPELLSYPIDFETNQEDRIKEAFDKVATDLSTTNNNLSSVKEKSDTIKDYIIETGSNARGSYEKWASGKLVQYGSVEKLLGNYTALTMTGVYRTNPVKHEFPIPFVGKIPHVVKDLLKISGDNGWEIKNDAPTLVDTGTIMLVRTVQSSAQTKALLNWYAVGRWK